MDDPPFTDNSMQYVCNKNLLSSQSEGYSIICFLHDFKSVYQTAVSHIGSRILDFCSKKLTDAYLNNLIQNNLVQNLNDLVLLS